ncbi:MAG TPA: hypothetical protein VF547_02050 [Allosphingosinicella sp.]
MKILVYLASPITISLILIGAMRIDGEFSRDIPQPPAVVAAALETVDVVDQPHAQKALREAGEKRVPQILAQRDPDGFSWFVMSRGKSVLRMKAQLVPSADGASTHVSTEVEPGEVEAGPDVPPLFASRSEVEPLFAIAVERALGDYIPRSERSLASLQELPARYKTQEEMNAEYEARHPDSSF